MVYTRTLSRELNALLDIRSMPDDSRNGLQVNASRHVKKVGLAVDASLDTFREAKKKRCDLVLVHHGIKWRGQRDEAGLRAARERYLRDSGINLYAAHLPLDRHGVYGNNIRLAMLLGLEDRRRFGKIGAFKIGYKGTLPAPLDVNTLKRRLDNSLSTRSVILKGNSRKVRSLGVVSGGGSKAFPQAYREGLDCFVTGEGPHKLHHEAKELGVNVILAGHYQTETLGVKALGEFLEQRFGVRTVFLDIPTVI